MAGFNGNIIGKNRVPGYVPVPLLIVGGYFSNKITILTGYIMLYPHKMVF